MFYLKDDQYYIDLYDLHTIEECLDWYKSLKKGMDEKKGEIKDLTPEEYEEQSHRAASYAINVIKIQRFRHKNQTIREWMEKDRVTQERFDKANPPEEIYCKDCFSRTKIMSKDLLGLDDEKVLFMFECVKCHKRQALYEDGTEWKYEPPKCPNCKLPLEVKSKDNKNISITTYSCTNCSYTKKDVLDFKKSREERIAKEAKDKKLLEQFRKHFCYDDDTGQKAVWSLDNMVRFAKEREEQEKKEKSPIYQKVKQLKTLKIGQLKELLEKTIEKEGYQDLAFAKPEMGQYVIIDFSVNDMKEDRKEFNSVNGLKKLIKVALEDTNWRLMSDGIHYRLGILTGKLKAYEQEEDLMGLVKDS